MSRRLMVLSGILAAAVAAYCSMHWWQMRRTPDALNMSGDPLAWVQREFQLTDTQFATVKALHESYEPKCAEMCLRIARANARVQTLTEAGRSMTPELAESIRAAQLYQAECRTAMLTHIYETAALLPPDDAPRYLRTVTSRLMQAGHCLTDVMSEKP